MSNSKFNHPDIKLQRLSRYYIDLYGKSATNYRHNLFFLAQIDSDYFCIDNIFSFEDERYTNYPNLGWLEYDYERVLELNLENKEDLVEFRLIAANLARIMYSNPSKILKIKDFPHFEQIVELVIIEGVYEYFGINSDDLILKCARNGIIKSGDSGALSMTKTLIFKTWYKNLSKFKKINFYITKKIISLLMNKKSP